MTSTNLTVERFGPASPSSKAANLAVRSTVKQILLLVGLGAEFLAEWAPRRLQGFALHQIVDRVIDRVIGLLLPPLDKGVSLSKLRIRGVDAEQHVPAVASDTTVLYLHGGAFVLGGFGMHRRLAGRLAVASGATVVLPNYRVLPSVPFPQVTDDCFAIYRQLIEDGFDPKKIVIAGDSAGGYLTIAVAQAARDAGLPLPAGLVVIAPWLDLRRVLVPPKELAEAAKGEIMIHPRWVRSVVTRLIGPHGPRALESPTDRDLVGLPPTLVQVSTTELLYPDAVRFAEALAAAGTAVRLEERAGQMHVLHVFADLMPEGRHAIASAGSFIRSVTRSAARASA